MPAVAARRARWSGRARESALLRDWWTSVRDGDGRLLLVDGDPGIGKTRLVAELARAVEAEGALVLWGRCDEDPVAPFQPFAEALAATSNRSRRTGSRACPTGSSTELSRLVLRLREYAPPLEEEAAIPRANASASSRPSTATLNELSPAAPCCW